MKTHFAEKKSLMDERVSDILLLLLLLLLLLILLQNSLNEIVDSLNSKLATSQHENLSMKDQLERLKRELQTAKQVIFSTDIKYIIPQVNNRNQMIFNGATDIPE